MNRRQFVQQSAAGMAFSAGLESIAELQATMTKREFTVFQQKRRRELWSLLGDLPLNHRPQPPKLLKTEKGSGYTLEYLILDLNGLEPVPALLLIPEKRQPRAPGMLYIHWHGGTYPTGKDELLTGRKVLPAYAPVMAEKGIVTLAIDSWCFGERMHDKDGRNGEWDAFKQMLWQGRVLFGMMLFDEFRAVDYLVSRPEVDPQRIGAFGLSMGATKAWWLAALDPRIKLCIDLCCMTDFQELMKINNLKGHGIYYYVPSLLKHFSTAQINELIVPRAHLSLNGRRDLLTPPAGVERVRDYLQPLYQRYGKSDDCRIELFDCGHEELPEMRQLVLAWLDKHLVQS
jgi:hypothetical protein